MRLMNWDQVCLELLKRQQAPSGQQFPWVLHDVLDGTMSASVAACRAQLHSAQTPASAAVAQAYAAFRHTHLNPLAAVHRWGLAPALLPTGQRHDDRHPCETAVHCQLLGSQPWDTWSTPAQRNRPADASYPHKVQILCEAAAFYHQEHSATFAALTVLEHSGLTLAPALADMLHCSLRTLERHLQAEGTNLEVLRAAVRLLRANQQLRTQAHLSTIALEVGYSDQAHMNRCFMRACGLTPRTLQQLYWGRTGKIQTCHKVHLSQKQSLQVLERPRSSEPFHQIH
jgi:AraC-like DNA-binding protein